MKALYIDTIALDRWMALSGTSNSDMARGVGVSPGAVSLWRTGARYPQERYVRLIQRFIEARNDTLMEALAVHIVHELVEVNSDFAY